MDSRGRSTAGIKIGVLINSAFLNRWVDVLLMYDLGCEVNKRVISSRTLPRFEQLCNIFDKLRASFVLLPTAWIKTNRWRDPNGKDKHHI